MLKNCQKWLTVYPVRGVCSLGNPVREMKLQARVSATEVSFQVDTGCTYGGLRFSQLAQIGNLNYSGFVGRTSSLGRTRSVPLTAVDLTITVGDQERCRTCFIQMLPINLFGIHQLRVHNISSIDVVHGQMHALEGPPDPQDLLLPNSTISPNDIRSKHKEVDPDYMLDPFQMWVACKSYDGCEQGLFRASQAPSRQEIIAAMEQEFGMNNFSIVLIDFGLPAGLAPKRKSELPAWASDPGTAKTFYDACDEFARGQKQNVQHHQARLALQVIKEQLRVLEELHSQ
eukprot:TRINITY_DN5714_c0_g1_i3.p1 TRINITY_DN5714_c0_g1~~TRINITY_DN5714_c0_g1_i3.p1  ORF type:complete len:286 (-),score=43.56 TRINITY_DN5714_c0_g1_i3:84-941(-)